MQPIKFPGWTFVYPSRVKFLITIPVSLILSYAFVSNKRGLAQTIKKNWIQFLILLLFLPFGINFMMSHLTELSNNPVLSEADIEAIEWVEQNVEKNATILNTITDIEAGAFIGDSAQWIPALANRKVLYPATSLTDELESDVIKNRTKVMYMLAERGQNTEEFLKLIKSYNIKYVFLSDNKMGSRGNIAEIKRDAFSTSEFYEEVFKNENVSIFRVNYPENL